MRSLKELSRFKSSLSCMSQMEVLRIAEYYIFAEHSTCTCIKTRKPDTYKWIIKTYDVICKKRLMEEKNSAFLDQPFLYYDYIHRLLLNCAESDKSVTVDAASYQNMFFLSPIVAKLSTHTSSSSGSFQVHQFKLYTI